MKKNFLVLGGDSKLAGCFKLLFPRECVVLKKKDCDITRKESIEKALRKYPCPYVLNCAALTDIDYCEKRPRECFKVNVAGVALLNKACKRFGRKLIHISSDYAVRPVNAYGRSKYKSERLMNPEMLAIRTNFYSLSTYAVKNLLHRRPANLYTNIFCNPVSLPRLANEIRRRKDQKGLLNIFTDKKVSWYQFSEKLCRHFKINPGLLRKAVYGPQKLRAPRPLSSYVRTDIKINLNKDLQEFKKYLLKLKFHSRVAL